MGNQCTAPEWETHEDITPTRRTPRRRGMSSGDVRGAASMWAMPSCAMPERTTSGELENRAVREALEKDLRQMERKYSGEVRAHQRDVHSMEDRVGALRDDMIEANMDRRTLREELEDVRHQAEARERRLTKENKLHKQMLSDIYDGSKEAEQQQQIEALREQNAALQAYIDQHTASNNSRLRRVASSTDARVNELESQVQELETKLIEAKMANAAQMFEAENQIMRLRATTQT